ncbi:MAG: cytochrome c maturation protein CcmE [Bacteroidia bacterium]|nr:cytochrome c maturation protein CcmE [Bacteroidia bacterium]MDW8089529.1 cytochrome c maturation protein CcmE [Bacteroidia bacterium]
MRLLVGAVAVGLLLAFLVLRLGEEVTIYTDFRTAQTNPHRTYHVIAQWVQREASRYDPQEDAFWFWAQDSLGTIVRVRYPDPKPVNFEVAQKVVLIGHYADSLFLAEKILMKCPSKYKAEGR